MFIHVSAAREVPTSPTKLRERTCQLKAETGYLDPAKARATGLLVEKLEKKNAATEEDPENEVDPFSYLVHGCLHVPPIKAQFSPIPTPARKALVPWVFYWKHKSLWRYAGCEVWKGYCGPVVGEGDSEDLHP